MQHRVVYLSIPTSNHNCLCAVPAGLSVVYLSIPTSNHNSAEIRSLSALLYICLFLHQTTTCGRRTPAGSSLYICLFLHQTTTLEPLKHHGTALYICLFLHQTTTRRSHYNPATRCISVYSYIKPQPIEFQSVYRSRLYICLFLHQTTTQLRNRLVSMRCISVYSYIKPQRCMGPI